MLTTLDTIAVMISMMINVVIASAVLPLGAKGRVVLATIAGLWAGLAIAAANAGLLAFAPDQPVPVIGVFFALPLGAMLLAWLLSPATRAALLAVPMHIYVGLNTMRVLGALFFVLAYQGRLGGPFPIVAGLGDVLTGLAGASLALSLARGKPVTASKLRWWNAFGAADLFIAVFLGMTSSPGALQLFHFGAGSEAMQHFPFSLVPTVLVPFYLITHGIVAAQLRALPGTPRLRANLEPHATNAAE